MSILFCSGMESGQPGEGEPMIEAALHKADGSTIRYRPTLIDGRSPEAKEADALRSESQRLQAENEWLRRRCEALEEATWPAEWVIAERERERWKKAEARVEELKRDFASCKEYADKHFFRAEELERENEHLRLQIDVKQSAVEEWRGRAEWLREENTRLREFLYGPIRPVELWSVKMKKETEET